MRKMNKCKNSSHRENPSIATKSYFKKRILNSNEHEVNGVNRLVASAKMVKFLEE